jgi:hypothetical protein
MHSLRIESNSRWDALALTRKLARYHWFLVEPDAEHWDVYVAIDDSADSVPTELRDHVVEWLEERELESARLHLDSADLVLTRD